VVVAVVVGVSWPEAEREHEGKVEWPFDHGGERVSAGLTDVGADWSPGGVRNGSDMNGRVARTRSGRRAVGAKFRAALRGFDNASLKQDRAGRVIND